jgi:hypothetical protein
VQGLDGVGEAVGPFESGVQRIKDLCGSGFTSS